MRSSTTHWFVAVDLLIFIYFLGVPVTKAPISLDALMLSK